MSVSEVLDFEVKCPMKFQKYQLTVIFGLDTSVALTVPISFFFTTLYFYWITERNKDLYNED